MAVPISHLLLQPNLATPETKKKVEVGSTSTKTQGTLQVEEQIPGVQETRNGKKPHTHRTKAFSRDVPLV